MQTLLVVDDERDVLNALCKLLQRSFPDVNVMGATSAAQALRTMTKERIDVVLSDYRMPEMDGVEFLRECERRQPRAARLLVTAFPNEAANQASHQASVPVVTKPVDGQALVAMVRAVLEGRGAIAARADPSSQERRPALVRSRA